MTAKAKLQVLAVGSDDAFELARNALGDAVRLVRAGPAPETAARRYGGVDPALADVRFDRARVIRLFRALRESPDARALPIVCCATPRAAAFVNVRRLTREYGEPVASEVLRQVVATRLAAPQERAASRRTR